MGLFGPKISPREAEYVRTKMTQLQDTVHLVNTTTKPDVFFNRLNFNCGKARKRAKERATYFLYNNGYIARFNRSDIIYRLL